MTEITVVVVYWGFAAILGWLIKLARRGQGWLNPVLFSGLLFLPASLGLPLSFPGVVLAWLAAGGVVWVFAMQPARLPAWLWQIRFFYIYFSGAMFLILVWSMLNKRSLNPTWIGLPALGAGLLILRKWVRLRRFL